MTNEDETVRAVCAKMRECKAESYSAGGCSDCRGFDCRDVREFADRILAAHEREMAANDAEIAKHERCYRALEVHCKKLEDEYLKATERR